MVCGNLILPEPANYVFFYAFSNLRKLLYLIAQNRQEREKPCTAYYCTQHKAFLCCRFLIALALLFSCHALYKVVIEQLLERHEVIARAAVGVHIVIDGNVTDAEHGEAFLDVKAGMELISAEAAEILGDDDPNLTVFHVGDHPLERWPLEITVGKTIIHIEAGIREMMGFGKLLQDIFLR